MGVVIRFDYPNDQAVDASADAMIESLSKLPSMGFDRLDIVCHSMGGLVAFDAITRVGFDEVGVSVDHFVTIGTPFGGSPWARLRAVAEMREQVQRWVESDDLDPKRLLGFARDGMGEAGEDLLPGSDFLVQLHARKIPDGVVVTCIVGKTLPAEHEIGMLAFEGALGDLLGRQDASVVDQEIQRLGKELGDGVVPMSSAVLDGVDDVVVLSANHRGLVRNVELGEAIRQFNGLEPSDEPPAIEVVLDRLRQKEPTKKSD